MITLHFEAASPEDLMRAVRDLARALNVAREDTGPPAIITTPVVLDTPLTAAEVATAVSGSAAPAAPVTLPQPVPHTPRRGRKPKSESPSAPVAVSAEAPATAAPAAPAGSANGVPTPVASALSIPTVDDVRAALMPVNEAFGMFVCTGLLQQYGAQRVSLVPEAKRAEFIAACAKKVADNKAAIEVSAKAAA